MTVLLPLLGVAVLGVLAVDVFVTVFLPEGHGGPLTRRASRLVWVVWRSLAPSGKRRDGWLALGGPFLAILAPALWATCLIAGFALVYVPWIETFLVSPGDLRDRWLETLYFSGVAAATLGTGDLVPDLPALRLLSVVESISGFALLSASLSYILAIYRENGRKTTLAAVLSLHHERGAGEPDAWLLAKGDPWLEHVARELLHTMGAHAQYPILHYFRPVDRRDALTVQLAPLVRLAVRPEVREAPPDGEPVPGGHLVAGALERYMAAADERFIIKDRLEEEDGPRPLQRRYLRLLEYLGYREDAAGFRTAQSVPS